MLFSLLSSIVVFVGADSCTFGSADESYDLRPFTGGVTAAGGGFSYYVSLCGDLAPVLTPDAGRCSEASVAYQYNRDTREDCVAVGGQYAGGVGSLATVRATVRGFGCFPLLTPPPLLCVYRKWLA